MTTTDLDDLMNSMYRDPDKSPVKDPDATAVTPAVREDRTAGAPDTEVTDADPETDENNDEDDDLFDEDSFTAAPRTSKLTLTLVALLILVVGLLAGVQLDRLFG